MFQQVEFSRVASCVSSLETKPSGAVKWSRTRHPTLPMAARPKNGGLAHLYGFKSPFNPRHEAKFTFMELSIHAEQIHANVNWHDVNS